MVAGIRCEICKTDITMEPCGCTEQDHINMLRKELADLKALNELYIERLQLEERNHNTLKQLVGEFVEQFESGSPLNVRIWTDKLKQAIGGE